MEVKNLIVPGLHAKPIPTDIFFNETGTPKPVVIYSHGFNGFKDWGNFDLIAQQFANAGFVIVKFNFSHNGTTPEHPEEFVDLDGYAQNNYTKELDDLGAVIDWVCNNNPYSGGIDTDRIALLGHSLGAGISLLKAAEDDRIKAIVTWASISECKTPWTNWPEEKLKDWKETGVAYMMNSRTKQNLPLAYQLYEDFQNNSERLNIERAVKSFSIPLLICHGTNDPAVPVSSAHLLKQWKADATLFLVASDHVFGRKHPWTADNLPEAMQQVVDKTIDFLLSFD